MGQTAWVEGGQVFFVRTDHIGRPVFVTNDLGVKVWEASYLPFGGVHSTTGGIDLRFPGQWFQSESGLHQNWMRDYDPTTGRYIQADPLGLVDGASVYGYALQNPRRYVDPRGETPGQPLLPSGEPDTRFPPKNPGQVCNHSSQCVIYQGDVYVDSTNPGDLATRDEYRILPPGQCTPKHQIDADYVWWRGSWYKCFGPAPCRVFDNGVALMPGGGDTGFYTPPWPNQNYPDSPPEDLINELECCG